MNVKQTALADYLQTLHWDSYFTATFAQHQRYSGTAMDRVVTTISNGIRLHPQKIFICAEQHKLGGWHCHGLLDYPNTRLGDGFQDKAVRLELASLGFNSVSEINGIGAATAYCAKYLNKMDREGDWRMVGRKKFWTPA